MKEKKVTIEKLAVMVQKGFEETATKTDLLELRNELKEEIGDLRKEVVAIRDHILKQYGWRISNLEAEIKSIKEQMLLK